MPQWLTLGTLVFGLIFLTELPDKTAVATMVLATRHPPVPVFAGVAAAFTIQSVVAIFAGSLLGLLPHDLVRAVAALLFFVMAILTVRKNPGKEEAEEAQAVARAERRYGRAFLTAFGVIFLSEWGDLSQLATAALQAHYRQPLVIFTAATLALWVVAAMAVMLGNRLGALIPQRPLQYAAAGVMVVVGIVLIIGVLV